MKYSLLTSLSVLLFGTTIHAGVVSRYGQLEVQGTRLTDKAGNAVILRGVSFGWHNWWPRFYNASVVNWLVTDWNCTVVRAAMGVEPDKGYITDPQWSEELICKVVDAAIENDIYVIIDWHCHNIQLDEAKQFFEKMAKRYGKYPNVIYEIFNEPVHQSWHDVKAYSEEIIKTIRAIDLDNIILVGSPQWDQAVDVAADDRLEGYSNVMYTLHFYAATHKQELRDKATYALNKGLPLFVSECASMEASGDGPINDEEWRLWIEWMQANNMSWLVWSVADKDETCSMIQRSGSSKGKWTEKQLKPWGIKVRNEIRKNK